MMRLRLTLALLLACAIFARASEAIDAPAGGASAIGKGPHVTAQLIPEIRLNPMGKPFGVILHLHMDPGWHTYWINPGEAGLATTIKWTLPEGWTAGPIQWPTPEKHAMGPITTYGYEGDVYLITTITPGPASDGTEPYEIRARVAWLACQEACIPGKAELTVLLNPLHIFPENRNDKLFAAARDRLPVPNTFSDISAMYGPDALSIIINSRIKIPADVVKTLQFFPEQPNVLSAAETSPVPMGTDPYRVTLNIKLQQNGEKPDKVSGVLVSSQPIIGTSNAVYLAPFSTGGFVDSEAKPLTSELPAPGSETPAAGTAAVTTGSPATQPLLLAVLGAAFIGGLILNLMPCVLPVLSLKVFSLIKHADDPRGAWKQGAAFTAGVVISFWILAGLLLSLRAAGGQLGWGFQMQSPGFVLFLVFLFFLLALNLLGVFEIGTSLVGLDAQAAGKSHGLTSSFLNGALATIAATPCTAPFMGSALGFAAQQPAFVSMLIFTVLALGMATPYLLLTIFPGALKFVPKPGAWMETFKHVMGFLLLLTVVWLVSVFGSLQGSSALVWLLAALWGAAIVAWAYGRWGFARSLLAALVVALAGWGLYPKADSTEKWQPWSQAAVDAALADGKPVFVDFTADWCLSCKVNERVAFGAESVQKAFADKNVILLKGDWTHSDPEISKTLQKFNRDGVPLYLLYSPKAKDQPQVLPEVLTPGIVMDALSRL